MSHLPYAEEDLVLRCARQKALGQHEGLGDTTHLDWARVVRWAVRHRLAGPLYQATQEVSLAVPLPVSAFLKTYVRVFQQQDSQLAQNCLAVQQTLQEHNLDCIYFPDRLPAPNAVLPESQAGGTELVVRSEQLEKITAQLEKMGYQWEESKARPVWHFWNEDRYLELRWQLPGRRASRGAVPLLTPRLARVCYGSQRTLVPHPEDWLVLQAMRGAEHHWNVLGAMVNFAEGVQACAEMNWPGLLRRADTWGGRVRLLLGLGLARRYFGIELPDEVAGQMEISAVREVVPRMAKVWVEEARGPKGTLEDLQWDWPLLDSPWERVRYAGHFAFTPTGADRGRWPWLTRPGRLLAKLIGRPWHILGRSLRKGPASLSTYAPSHANVVDAMLDLAGVTAEDVVFDLGCGDGRIVIRACQKYGARGVGIDLDRARVREAEANARAAGVSGRAQFLQGDVLRVDLRRASVLTMFLPRFAHLQIGATLAQRAQPGTRVVSKGSDTGAWDEARVVTAQGVPEPIFLRVVRAPGEEAR
jgi:hypothetical protein